MCDLPVPRQKVPLHPILELGRLHAAGAEEEVDPLLFRKALPCIDDLVLIQIGHLDRCDVVDNKRALLLLVLVVEIGQVNDAPDTSGQQLVVFTDVLRVDVNTLDPEEQKVCLVLIDALVQLDR